MKTTRYFEEERPVKHPEVSREQAAWVAQHFEHQRVQPCGRIRRWAFVEELDHYVRVILLSDGETLHNAFVDSNPEPLR
jgi:hypothetical protein